MLYNKSSSCVTSTVTMDPLWQSVQNSTLNDTNENFEHQLLAVKSHGFRLFFESIYSLTAFLAFVGNCVVIVVELLGKRSAPNLRKYLINLAVSDILIGVFTVPFIYTDFMYGQWIFPRWLCPFSQFIQVVSVFVTSFTLVNIGLERLAGTLYPFSSLNRCLKQNGNIILVIGWIYAAILGFYPLLHTEAQEFFVHNVSYYDCKFNENKLTTFASNNNNSSPSLDSDMFVININISDVDNTTDVLNNTVLNITVLDIDYNNNTVNNDTSIGRNAITFLQIYSSINFLSTFLLPLIIMISTYGTIGHQLFHYDSPISMTDRHQIDKIKIFKMLLAVVVIFFVCWFPVKTFVLLFYWLRVSELDWFWSGVYVYGFLTFYWLAMANSFVNPIIYCFMSKNFRADLCDIIIKVCEKISGVEKYDTVHV